MIKPKAASVRSFRGAGGKRTAGAGSSPGRAKMAIVPAVQETYSPSGRHGRGFRNGVPDNAYLPADPGRRARYLEALQAAQKLADQRPDALKDAAIEASRQRRTAVK